MRTEFGGVRCLSWVRTEFLVCGGIALVFLNLIDTKEGIHETNSATFIKRFDD